MVNLLRDIFIAIIICAIGYFAYQQYAVKAPVKMLNPLIGHWDLDYRTAAKYMKAKGASFHDADYYKHKVKSGEYYLKITHNIHDADYYKHKVKSGEYYLKITHNMIEGKHFRDAFKANYQIESDDGRCFDILISGKRRTIALCLLEEDLIEMRNEEGLAVAFYKKR